MPKKQKELEIPKGKNITPEIAFALVLRQRRAELGLRQEDLEDEDGLDRSYISKLELAKNQIRLGHFIKLARKLKLTPQELMALVVKQLEA